MPPSDAGQGTFTPAEPREMSEADVMSGIEGLLDPKPERKPPTRHQPQRASDVPAEPEQP